MRNLLLLALASFVLMASTFAYESDLDPTEIVKWEAVEGSFFMTDWSVASLVVSSPDKEAKINQARLWVTLGEHNMIAYCYTKDGEWEFYSVDYQLETYKRVEVPQPWIKENCLVACHSQGPKKKVDKMLKL